MHIKEEILRDKKDRFAWNSFSKITNITDLSEYLTREYEHTEYHHHTNLVTIYKILKNRGLCYG